MPLGPVAWVGDAILVSTARSILTDVADETQESAHLSVLEGTDLHYLHGVEPNRVLKVTAVSEQRLPAICSGAGKSILATLPEEAVNYIFADYFPTTVSRKITSLSDLFRELEHCRTVGYGTTVEEFGNGVSGVGVAVLGMDDRAIAGLSVAIPTYRFDDVNHAKIESVLRRASISLAEALRTKSTPLGTG